MQVFVWNMFSFAKALTLKINYFRWNYFLRSWKERVSMVGMAKTEHRMVYRAWNGISMWFMLSVTKTTDSPLVLYTCIHLNAYLISYRQPKPLSMSLNIVRPTWNMYKRFNLHWTSDFTRHTEWIYHIQANWILFNQFSVLS